MPKILDLEDPVVRRTIEFRDWCLAGGKMSLSSTSVLSSMVRRILTIAVERCGSLEEASPADAKALITSDHSVSKATSLVTPRAWKNYCAFRKEKTGKAPAELPASALPRRSMNPDDRVIAEYLRKAVRMGLAVPYILKNARWCEEGFMSWPRHKSWHSAPGTWPNDIVPDGVLEIGLWTDAGKPPRTITLRVNDPHDLAFLKAIVPRAFPEITAGAHFGFDVVAKRDRGNRLEKNWIFRKASGKAMTPRDAQALLDQLAAEEAAEAAAPPVEAAAAALGACP